MAEVCKRETEGEGREKVLVKRNRKRGEEGRIMGIMAMGLKQEIGRRSEREV